MTRVFATLSIVATLSVTGCEPRQSEPSKVLDSSELQGLAVVEAISQATPDPITDVRAILPLGPDRIVLLDGTEPFLRVFGADGQHIQSGGREGDGPGEFRNPWAMALQDSVLWVWDRSFLKSLDPVTLEETGRYVVSGILHTILIGCDNQLVAVYEGGSLAGSDERTFGVKIHQGDTTWTDVTGQPEYTSPMAVGWPRYAGLPFEDGILTLHFWARRLEIISCDGKPTRSRPLPTADEWELAPVPEGAVALGADAVLFYGHRTGGDTTYAAIWRPGTDTLEQRSILGALQIHGSDDSLVWLVNNVLEPIVFAVKKEDFAQFLGL